MIVLANFVAAAIGSAEFVSVVFAQVAVVEPVVRRVASESFFLHSVSERKLCRLPI